MIQATTIIPAQDISEAFGVYWISMLIHGLIPLFAGVRPSLCNWFGADDPVELRPKNSYEVSKKRFLNP
jgi:hypothetical protein